MDLGEEVTKQLNFLPRMGNFNFIRRTVLWVFWKYPTTTSTILDFISHHLRIKIILKSLIHRAFFKGAFLQIANKIGQHMRLKLCKKQTKRRTVGM